MVGGIRHLRPLSSRRRETSAREREVISEQKRNAPKFASAAVVPPLGDTIAHLMPKRGLLSPRDAALVDDYVIKQTQLGLAPTVARVAGYIYVASDGRVSTAQTRRYLRLRFPEYLRTQNVSRTRSKAGTLPTLFGHALGSYAIDLAFFTKTVSGHTRRDNACLIVYCAGGSRLLLLETIHNNRSAASLLEALEACRKRLISTYGRPEGFRRLYSDQETSLKSKLIGDWQEEHSIEIIFYTLSAKKSYLAERMIQSVRVQIHRAGIVNKDTSKPYALLEAIERAHNTTKIMFGTRESAWSPGEVNASTYAQFITHVFQQRPAQYFALYSLGEEYIPFRFPLDSYVYLKRAAISSNALEKRSVRTVDTDRLFVVVARYTLVSQLRQLVPYYRISPVFDWATASITPESTEAALNAPSFIVPETSLVSQ